MRRYILLLTYPNDATISLTFTALLTISSRWLLFQPVLKIWLASDSHTHDAIYAAASFEGIYEELCAHLEAKGGLEIFEDDNYAEYLSDTILDEGNESPGPGFNAHENATKSLKQENLARFLRSQNFDSIHSEMVGKLQRVVSSCVALRNEIIQREELRSTMNSYMMELSHALEEDLEAYLSRCEREATKSVSSAMKDLQAREVQPSTSLDNDRLANNTELNSISILPKLFEEMFLHIDKPSLTLLRGPDHRLALEEKALAEHSLETTGSSAELEELKAFKTQAVAYIKSFNSWNYSKLYKWCKHNKKGSSVEDIHGSVMKLFPLLHGPVELIGQGQLRHEQLPKESKSTRTSNRKSRRATTIGDSSSSNFDYMKKSMVEEAQRKISEIASKKSDVLYGPVAKTSQISLSDRETRISLQSNRVVKEDDDTTLDTDEGNGRLEQEPTTSEPHQYRRHTSLNTYGQSADQSHHFRKDGKCFLYVTLLNLSAHSALSARQVLRTLQSVSAANAADSVSQISSVLTKALAESSSVDDNNRTIDAMEDIATEEHVGSFASTCDANFLNARSAVESWIGQNVGNGYATFKAALLDLLSSKQLDFAAEGSSLNAATEQQQGGAAAVSDQQSSMMQNGEQVLSSDGFNSNTNANKLSSLNSDPGRGTAADIDSDLSRRILSTIENNINAFVSNNNDLFGEDDDQYPAEMMKTIDATTSLHRSTDHDFRIVPSIAGSSSSSLARRSIDSEVKSRKASTAEHVSKLVHGGSMLSNRSSYHISSNSKKLHSMELALKGKLFTADFIWEQDHSQLGIVMRHYTNK